MKHLKIIFPLLMLTLLACNLGQIPLPTPLPSPSPSFTILPSHTIQPAPSLSPTPTFSQTPSQTPTFTLTPSQTPSPIPSPTPTKITLDPKKLGTSIYNVTYCIADSRPLLMDVYYPADGNGPLPVTVYVHGGYWSSGDKSKGAGYRFIDTLLKRGYLVVAINYRLAPQYQFPAQIEDAKCAIRHLRANAGRYGLDPRRIGVFGSSAGGHLAALLGTSGTDTILEGQGGYLEYSSRVQAVVDMFGPTTADFFCIPNVIRSVFGTSDCQSEVMTIASPLTYITPDDVPFLILHGDKDDVVPIEQSARLYTALVSAGVPAELIVVKNAGHSFTPVGKGIAPSFKALQQLVGDFFDQNLKGLR